MVNIEQLPKVISIEHGPEPTWGDDAGRVTNSAKFSGTFVGYVDKIKINFGHTTPQELLTIKNALEVAIIEDVKFLDSSTNTYVQRDFYGTVINVKRSKLNGLYSAFSITLVAISVR